MKARSITFFLLLLVFAAGAASAQSVRGRVIDAESSTPVANVRVVLLNQAGTRVAETMTDSAGAFVLNGRGPGEYTLQISHVAYRETRTEKFELAYMETAVVDVRASKAVIALAPLEVKARQREKYHDATYEGLYARAAVLPKVGSNRVFMRTGWEMQSVTRVSELLQRHVPPLRCQPIVFWNGFLVQNAAIAQERLTASVDDLEAVEIYRDPLMAPFAFREEPGMLRSWRCTVVALWPRRGG
jgi:hypothetical protein